MKLSDKALRLIGRSLLEGMDEKTHQDEPQNSRSRARGEPTTAARSRPLLQLRRCTTDRKAAVLPFRARRPPDG